MAAQEQSPHSQAQTRVHVFDVVRGFSVISMVLFHLCYDLKFISGVPLAWFAPPLQDIWRASISWAFVSVAGCMFAYSRDNLRRSLKYLAVAALVFVVTTFAAVDTPINFGIIYCMGACTLTCVLLDRLGFRPCGPAAAAVLFVLFLVLLPLAQGRIGIGGLTFALPRELYATPYLSWLGLPGPTFASGDYYPLLPYLLLYLAGSALGRYFKQGNLPAQVANISCPPLETVGKLALPIYVLHQPLLLMITSFLIPA